MNLEQYLRDECDKGHVDHYVEAIVSHNETAFRIRSMDDADLTAKFKVEGGMTEYLPEG